MIFLSHNISTVFKAIAQSHMMRFAASLALELNASSHLSKAGRKTQARDLSLKYTEKREKMKPTLWGRSCKGGWDQYYSE